MTWRPGEVVRRFTREIKSDSSPRSRTRDLSADRIFEDIISLEYYEDEAELVIVSVMDRNNIRPIDMIYFANDFEDVDEEEESEDHSFYTFDPPATVFIVNLLLSTGDEDRSISVAMIHSGNWSIDELVDDLLVELIDGLSEED